MYVLQLIILLLVEILILSILIKLRFVKFKPQLLFSKKIKLIFDMLNSEI